ncbi:MAG TPA: hypothetical protein VF630_09680 [Hymenobacter sp.]
MEPVLPPAAALFPNAEPATAPAEQAPEVLPRPVPAYPTLRESWATMGWYLLAALVVGGPATSC